MIDNDSFKIISSRTYIDGKGNPKEFPSKPKESDLRLILKAKNKRVRKAKRNLLLHANAWIGDEHCIPQPSITSFSIQI